MTDGMIVLLGVLVYFAILIGIGAFSYRMSYRTPEDFFIARRGIGTFALFIVKFPSWSSMLSSLGI